jgi:hypothetical protein
MMSGAESTTHHPDEESTDEHGNAAVAVHESPGRECGKRACRQENCGPEAQNRLDPGDEDEGDRGNGGRELQNPRQGDEAESEQDRVLPDLALSRHGASVSVYDDPDVTGSSGQPG